MLTIHRPYPLLPDDSSSINTSAWSVKPLLGYADVKNAWSFTSSPFIRFYGMKISKDIVLRLKNNYNFVSVTTHMKIILCGNRMPTRCNRWFLYCRSYCLLNMFRAPLCPSSGAQEYYTGGCCLWYLFFFCFQVVGLVLYTRPTTWGGGTHTHKYHRQQPPV